MIGKQICTHLTLVLASFSIVAQAAATTTYDTSLASPTSNPATPGCYNGTGCPNSGFTVSDDGTTELGLNATLRYIGPAPDVGDAYTVPAGTRGGYALWDYRYSIDTQPNGVGGATLSDYTYLLTLTDLTTSATFSFDPLSIPDDAVYGPSGSGYGVNSPTTQWGAQNAENLSFPGVGIPSFNPYALDSYQVTLSEYAGASLVNSDTIEVTATTPEPATFYLFCAGLFGLALVARKRWSPQFQTYRIWS
jgi:hypothetical protein